MTVNHLEPCTFAIVRSADGYVLDIVAASHDNPELLIHINHLIPESTYVVDCCRYGRSGVGSIWDGYEFRPPKPELSWRWDSANAKWIPPIPYPGGPLGDGKTYFWNENIIDWSEVDPSAVALQ